MPYVTILKKVLTSDYCNFKESVFGKALNICVKKIPENPNFDEILYFYKENYFKSAYHC